MSEKKKSSGVRKATSTRKVNRAQMKAIEVRASETRVDVQAEVEREIIESAQPSDSRARTRRTKTQPVASKVALLSRAQEYAFIRSDFRRLLITAGTLLAIMLVSLVIIE